MNILFRSLASLWLYHFCKLFGVTSILWESRFLVISELFVNLFLSSHTDSYLRPNLFHLWQPNLALVPCVCFLVWCVSDFLMLFLQYHAECSAAKNVSKITTNLCYRVTKDSLKTLKVKLGNLINRVCLNMPVLTMLADSATVYYGSLLSDYQ